MSKVFEGKAVLALSLLTAGVTSCAKPAGERSAVVGFAGRQAGPGTLEAEVADRPVNPWITGSSTRLKFGVLPPVPGSSDPKGPYYANASAPQVQIVGAEYEEYTLPLLPEVRAFFGEVASGALTGVARRPDQVTFNAGDTDVDNTITTRTGSTGGKVEVILPPSQQPKKHRKKGIAN